MLPRAEQQGFHSASRHTDRRRDLAHRQLLAVVKDDGGSFAEWQPLDEPPEVPALVLGHQHIESGGSGRRISARLRLNRCFAPRAGRMAREPVPGKAHVMVASHG